MRRASGPQGDRPRKQLTLFLDGPAQRAGLTIAATSAFQRRDHSSEAWDGIWWRGWPAPGEDAALDAATPRDVDAGAGFNIEPTCWTANQQLASTVR